MAEMKHECSDAEDLVVMRVFDAPVEQVWRAWVEPEMVKQWYSPEGFTAPVAEIDFREHGTSLVCMRSPEGQEYCNTWTYRRIEPRKRLEFIANFADSEGCKVDPAEWDMPEMQQDIPTEVTFESMEGGKTRMTYIEHGYTSKEMREMSEMGFNQSLDKLEVALAA